MQLVLNVLNGALNVTFVVGLNMGVDGVALGTVIAEWFALVVGIFILFKHLPSSLMFRALFGKMTWQFKRMRRMLNVNGFIFLRTLLLLAAFMMVTKCTI